MNLQNTNNEYFNTQLQIELLDLPAIYLLTLASKVGLSTENGNLYRLIGSGLGFIQYWLFSSISYTYGIAKSNTTWDVLSTINTAILGILFFGEQLKTSHLLGLLFSILGIYLINQ